MATKISLRDLDALQERLLTTLRFLHAKNISFPITTRAIAIQPDRNRGTEMLFLPFNPRATWGSDKLSPTWKEDELAAARGLIHIAKLFSQLSNGSAKKPVLLDPPSQQVLNTYICREYQSPGVCHRLCFDTVAPMTAALARTVASVVGDQGLQDRCLD
ncbi:hypothetical protein F4819DRAFT_441704, partial [Hypoxylon fuscum]